MLELRPTRSIDNGDGAYIRPRSRSKSRKPPLPRRRSSSRSIKSIPIDLGEDGDLKKENGKNTARDSGP